MTSLHTKSNDIWAAIQEFVDELIGNGRELDAVDFFLPSSKYRVGQHQGPTLVVISRTIRVLEWGANTGVGELAITLGVTRPTFHPEEVGVGLEYLLQTLVGRFMEQPTLGGADDVRVEQINPDDDPFGSEEVQPWATATLAWVFQFIHPRGGG